ncbi:PREDICTED: uncharacterized protein LOC106820690 [Priapulus caudatus]|uniref:Uncharacterized protein LOC106820690 n=1 Tax=Priapulus caudatus TaxID=37621 RepID=A0ABM1F8A7_PRICU|nr:PREDICTED: uncharacterized protein LOC106820690 [Priapulus caudatus]XP_014680679.1 PREDICTED: uncharacterized protein LOC106820690 [Priapulus caudatus]XP_014680681.1 PREDICTED: uncharacterized protein LOC106820690 [Priapulus caudatus]
MGCSNTTPQQDMYSGYRNGQPAQNGRQGTNLKSSDIPGENGFPKQQWQKYPTEDQRNSVSGSGNANTAEAQSEAKADKDISIEVIQRYLEIVRQLKLLDTKNTASALVMKTKLQKSVTNNIEKLTTQHELATQQMLKEKADVDNLQAYLKENSSSSKEFTTEQEEYMEALNKVEMAKKELDVALKQIETLNLEIQQLHAENNEVETLHREQDEILGKIFDGEYGSEQEDQLESELSLLKEQQRRMDLTRYNWQTARMMSHHACNQLAFAVRRWQESSSETNLQRKTHLVTEVRNYVVAAIQNLRTADQQLEGITFPYCGPEELDTLGRAAHYVFTDMQSAERHAHALQCYDATHKRCAALLYWFTEVINNRILVDLARVNEEMSQKDRALHRERMLLMQEKVRQALGEAAAQEIDIESLSNPNQEVELREPEVEYAEADRVSICSNMADGEQPDLQAEVTEETDGEQLPTPAVPSQADLFGNIENLKKQHEEELAAFQQAQQENRVRMQAGLQEKLNARRRRRIQMEAQEAEQVALSREGQR